MIHDNATGSVPASSTSPQEVSTLPKGAHGQLDDGTPAAWQKVDAPRAVTDVGPIEDAGIGDAPPPVPRAVKVIGVMAVAVLLGLAVWLGMTLGSTPAASPTPSPSPSPTKQAWPLEAPQVVDSWVQGTTSTTQPLAEDGPLVLRSDYSDGKDRMALLLSRPEDDPRTYLKNAGIVDSVAINNAQCGTQADTKVAVCAQVVDGTGIMLVGLSDQSTATLTRQLERFRKMLTK